MPPKYVCGLDLGQLHDYSALCALERVSPALPGGPDSFALRHLHRWPLGSSYPSIVAAVAALLSRDPLNGQARLAIDATGVGVAVLDVFKQATKPMVVARDHDGRAVVGLPATLKVESLVPVTITGGTATTRTPGGGHGVPKRDLVGAVQVALQSGRLRIAADLPLAATLIGELENFRYAIGATGHTTYGAGEEWRSGNHDDLVLALAIGLWAASARVGGAAMLTT